MVAKLLKKKFHLPFLYAIFVGININRLEMKTVKLITCNDAMQAHILQGALENEGIDSVLHNENFSSLMNGFVNYISGVDLLVAEKDYDAAVQVLRQNQSYPEDLILCPFCGSSEIKFVLTKEHRLRAIGSAILGALVMAPPGNNHWDYVCRKCQQRFDRPVSKFPQTEQKEELSK